MWRRAVAVAPRPVLQRRAAPRALVVVATAHRGRSGGDAGFRAGAALAGLGAAAASATLLGLGMGPLRCDSGPSGAEYDVKVMTYNLLAPLLSDEKRFPYCAPGCTEHENRWPKIVARLGKEVESGTVIGLQEVDLLWAGKLHAYFAERGYMAVFAQYGTPFSNYMGVMMAWPQDKYEALGVDISKIRDTAQKDLWPKAARNSSGLTQFGYLTWNSMKEVLGCAPPEQPKDDSTFEWDKSKSRENEAVFVKLRPRGRPDQPSFCVATYHMPCLFGTPEKLRVMNIHSHLLISKLKAFAGNDAAVLMGDFNIKPWDSPYALIESGGDLDKAAAVNAADLQGLKERLSSKKPWPMGLRSAYREQHQKEPLFTNFAQTGGEAEPFVECLDYIWISEALTVVGCPKLPATKEEVSGPFPNGQEPSDHLPLRATLRVSPASASKL